MEAEAAPTPRISNQRGIPPSNSTTRATLLLAHFTWMNSDCWVTQMKAVLP